MSSFSGPPVDPRLWVVLVNSLFEKILIEVSNKFGADIDIPFGMEVLKELDFADFDNVRVYVQK